MGDSPRDHGPRRIRGRWAHRLQARAALALMLTFVAGTAGVLGCLYYESKNLYQGMALQGTALQAQTLKDFRALYATEIAARVRSRGVEVTHDYATRPGAIPLPATLTIELGRRIERARPGAHIRLYSDYPFPWRKDRRPKDDFEAAALRQLGRDPDRPFYRFEAYEGGPSLRYAVADRMEASCVACHNRHPDSPKADWKVGDVRGVLEFIRPLDNIGPIPVARARASLQWTLGLTMAAAGLGLAGLGLVISRLHRTTEALRVTEARSRAIVETAADGIITLDGPGIIGSFNPAAERMFGYPADEVIGRDLTMLLPSAGRAGHDGGRGPDPGTAAGENTCSYSELIGRRRDGTTFPIELTVGQVPLSGRDRFTGIIRDVTGRKQAEEALRKGEALMKGILESSLDGIVTIDHHGRVIEFNAAAEAMFGYRRAEVLGQSMAELIVPPPLREAHNRGLARYLATGEGPVLGRRIVLTAMRADGSEFPAELAIVPILRDGAPVFTAFVRDITERMRTEAALEERARLAALDAEVGVALTRGATLREVLRQCAECLVHHLDAAFARIWMLDPTGEVLELQASVGMYTHLDGPHGRVPVGQFKIGMIARERRPHLTNAVIGDPRVGDQDWARREGMVAFAGYPLLVDDRLVGVMALFARQPLSEHALQAMASVANGIALAIERHRAAERLAHQATHDALTGLPNRTLLQQHLEQAVASARANHATFALLLIDLDRFKEINDTFGHHYGDVVLQELNPRLRDALRKSDVVARLGGDEFGAVLPGADEAGAVVAAEKVLEGLKRPIVVDGIELDVGASIGIAVYPEHGEDAITLMQRADVAMYAAKRVHGGHAVYSPDQSGYSPRRLALICELRQGIENDQLLLHYQPKVDLRTMRVGGAEALIRWMHPREGMIPPGLFIPLAEHTGLIKPLGMWTLHTTLLQCRVWDQAGLNLNIAVNLAPENLQDPQLTDAILKLIEASDAKPTWLTVEITEGAIMADPARARATLRRLRELGVRIAIDDFGTGYSSLAYLKTLPVDEVKIDRCFVNDMIGSEKDASIVRAVIDLGHTLGLKVVAEGVEDRASLDLLASWGCDLAQGFYFSRPLPPADFMDWVTQSTWRHPLFPRADGRELIVSHERDNPRRRGRRPGPSPMS